MRNIFLGALFLLTSVGYSQITVEILSPEGSYKTHTDSLAQVHIEVKVDRLLIYNSDMVATYQVDTILVSQPSPCGGFLGCYEVFIKNERHELEIITLWTGLNLVTFEYKDGLQVINRGEGITYCTGEH